MPHVMMDNKSNPKDMMKYSPKVPVKRILLPFNSKLLKKILGRPIYPIWRSQTKCYY